MQTVEGKPLSMVGTPTHLSHLGSLSAVNRGPLEPPKISKPWSLSCLRPAPPLKPSAALGYKEVRGRRASLATPTHRCLYKRDLRLTSGDLVHFSQRLQVLCFPPHLHFLSVTQTTSVLFYFPPKLSTKQEVTEAKMTRTCRNKWPGLLELSITKYKGCNGRVNFLLLWGQKGLNVIVGVWETIRLLVKNSLMYLFIYFQLWQSRAERSGRCTDRVQLRLQLLQRGLKLRRGSILVSSRREMSEKKSRRADQNNTQTRVRLINQPADSPGRFSVVWYHRP